MEWYQVIILAVIQGFTEFLPISSSAHLILPKELLGWQDQGLAFDVAVHVGSLAAVIIYFHREVNQLLIAWLRSFVGDSSDSANMAWYLLLATAPVAICGLLFNDFIENHLRSIAIIAISTIVFGLLLGFADKKPIANTKDRSVDLISALIIGCSQAIALIPGTSRSGITITFALLLGFNREVAAKFSFLLAIPVICLSGGYQGIKLFQSSTVPWIEIIIATLLSGITAYLCIHFFLKLINQIGMLPFVFYRLVLGAILILFLWI